MFTCKPWLRLADSGAGEGGGSTPPVPTETVSKAEFDALQAKYAQLEQSTNLALEVANGKVKEFETANESAKLDVERYKIAMSQGLTVDDIEFLNGTTVEAITAQATKLATRLKPVSRNPQPDFSQGSGGTPPATSKADLFAQSLQQTLGK